MNNNFDKLLEKWLSMDPELKKDYSFSTVYGELKRSKCDDRDLQKIVDHLRGVSVDQRLNERCNELVSCRISNLVRIRKLKDENMMLRELLQFYMKDGSHVFSDPD